ncbi:hypothetical protein [Deinococcus yunweiensis]|uniref:hypothetical protein n=1 Tax=Deinococcus yunweiensis TaxID=367282 RepID=UPI00398E9EA9
MTLSALELLRQQNTRTVSLLLDGDAVHSVEDGTPGAIPFELVRVNARDIRQDIVYAALGRDGFVRYATWYNAEAQRALAQAQALTRAPSDPPPFDDTPPDDAVWRAHSVAIEAAVMTAVLTHGMRTPSYREAQDILGLYGPALMLELVEWGRPRPRWQPPAPLDEDATPEVRREAEENDASGKSLRGPSVPP